MKVELTRILWDSRGRDLAKKEYTLERAPFKAQAGAGVDDIEDFLMPDLKTWKRGKLERVTVQYDGRVWFYYREVEGWDI